MLSKTPLEILVSTLQGLVLHLECLNLRQAP